MSDLEILVNFNLRQLDSFGKYLLSELLSITVIMDLSVMFTLHLMLMVPPHDTDTLHSSHLILVTGLLLTQDWC